MGQKTFYQIAVLLLTPPNMRKPPYSDCSVGRVEAITRAAMCSRVSCLALDRSITCYSQTVNKYTNVKYVTNVFGKLGSTPSPDPFSSLYDFLLNLSYALLLLAKVSKPTFSCLRQETIFLKTSFVPKQQFVPYKYVT